MLQNSREDDRSAALPKSMLVQHRLACPYQINIGAIKGQIFDADGSTVLYDLFTEFGVSQHAEIDFDLDAATPAAGAVKKKCHMVKRKIEDELGATPYEHIHALCGSAFFDDLITHSEVTEAYNRHLDGLFLRQGQARGSFEYAGIVFEEYRGKVGSVDFTDTNKAWFFPVGVPGLCGHGGELPERSFRRFPAANRHDLS